MTSRWWYLSFAVESAFLGACIVKADGLLTATMAAHMLGINPGGQVMGVEIPVGRVPDLRYMERRLTKADIAEFWPDAKSLKDHEKERLS